jgi:hypothetical protein
MFFDTLIRSIASTYPASVNPTQKKEHKKYNEHDADKAYTPVPITIAVTAVTTADPS